MRSVICVYFLIKHIYSDFLQHIRVVISGVCYLYSILSTASSYLVCTELCSARVVALAIHSVVVAQPARRITQQLQP